MCLVDGRQPRPTSFSEWFGYRNKSTGARVVLETCTFITTFVECWERLICPKWCGSNCYSSDENAQQCGETCWNFMDAGHDRSLCVPGFNSAHLAQNLPGDRNRFRFWLAFSLLCAPRAIAPAHAAMLRSSFLLAATLFGMLALKIMPPVDFSAVVWGACSSFRFIGHRSPREGEAGRICS
jgi:hypothetical protein